jgi:hypothetical protein
MGSSGTWRAVFLERVLMTSIGVQAEPSLSAVVFSDRLSNDLILNGNRGGADKAPCRPCR